MYNSHTFSKFVNIIYSHISQNMFSGIVEEAARVVEVTTEGTNRHIRMACTFTDQLRIDQSIAHNGVCLTVVALHPDSTYTVTAIEETLRRSNLGTLTPGSEVNLERSMKMDGRLDGHIVQGHVDTTATVIDIEEADGSRYYTFRYSVTPELARKGYVTVEKGSVTVNGVSLTVCDSQADTFRVAIIPYTYEHTNFHTFTPGTIVNLEFDIIGKYLSKMLTYIDNTKVQS